LKMAEAKEKPPGAVEFTFPDQGEENKEENKEEKAPEVTEEGEDEVQIEITDDTPPGDRGFKPGVSGNIAEVSDEELETYSAGVKKRIKELSFARHDERRVKDAALREKNELERYTQRIVDENKKLKEYLANGEQIYAGTAKAAAQAKMDIAKSRYKEAHEAFDADAIIAATQELTTAQMELKAAEDFRPSSLQPTQEGVYDGSATEQARPDQRALSWQQQNPWFGTDRRMTAYALAAHQDIVESGLNPQSDEYYKRIDAEIRQQFPKFFGTDPTSAGAPAQSHRKPANVVAPTARSRGARKISLTQTQVDLAKRLGITLEDYAKHVSMLETPNAT
jgi:hypothetical protein